MKLLDCTLRDGGYYNNWDFDIDVVNDYLQAMESLEIDFVEIGFRSLKNHGFKGAFAYSNDTFLKTLKIPKGLSNKIGVMINGSEICEPDTQISSLKKLFKPKKHSIVSLVRVACHVDEFKNCLPAANWLKENGYLVGFNLMQISDRSLEDITKLAKEASSYPIDVLYFADSLGSLDQEKLEQIILAFKKGWNYELGIHTHDNMGQAVNNSKQAVKLGANWIDSTVTGMGRGPGNAQTEYIILALSKHRQNQGSSIKLFEIINKYFKPMQKQYGWGINPFYYLAGLHGIHPSYIQEMLQDNRYDEEDILSVMEYLKKNGGKTFSLNTLEASRHFFSTEPNGTWKPKNLIKDKNVLILGAGPGIKKHKNSIESFIEHTNTYVIALNTQSNIRNELINARAACHPVRLLANCNEHLKLPQPLITPFTMLPRKVKSLLSEKELLDFGVKIGKNFKFFENYCELPTSLVIAYAIAVANSGQANQIYLAGFDGYNSEDPRKREMDEILKIYEKLDNKKPIKSITPTRYQIPTQSIYGMYI